MRKSGEPFIDHPCAVAEICAELKLDSATITAALLHDTVEDTEAELDDVRTRFGEDVALLVDGVTKLTRISFASREQAQVENYRKMIVAMAHDLRVVLIKLADRLHNMRTISALGKQKQVQTARETLEIYAPLAHRLGIHSIKWELEDLAFACLHPRRYAEIGSMVNQTRAERERFAGEAGTILLHELEEAGITADIAGRAKHLYSIYTKMAQGGKEFNEIYDLTAIRVLVDSVKDCYGAIGIIHSLWKPMPGRFKDYVAMPKFNMYQSLHTTVIGTQGKPLEIQVRTHEMHQTAEYGIAAHWLYKQPSAAGKDSANAWVAQLADWQADARDPKEFMDTLRVDLFSDEVYVFTPKGEVKSLPVGSTPLDFAYAVHTDVGHRCVGAKVNGRIVPLHYTLQSGEFVEVLTSKQERGPSRDWLMLVKSSRARNKIRQWFTQQAREDLEQRGRESLQQALKSHGLPHQKVSSSPLLAGIIREMGFKKADDFYVAIGAGKVQVGQVVTQADRAAEDGRGRLARPAVHAGAAAAEAAGRELRVRHRRRRGRRPGRARAHGQVLHARARRRDLRLHLARTRHHDPPRRLPQRARAAAHAGAVHAGALGRPPTRRHELVPGHDRPAVVGSPATARGRRPHLRRARREHRRVRRARRRPDGPQLVHRRGGRREGAAQPALGAAQHRRRVRRVPRHARRLTAGRLSRVSGYEGETTVWQGHPSWKAMLLFYVKWTLISLIPIAIWVRDRRRPGRASRPRGSPPRRSCCSCSRTSIGWVLRVTTRYLVTDRRIQIRVGDRDPPRAHDAHRPRPERQPDPDARRSASSASATSTGTPPAPTRPSPTSPSAASTTRARSCASPIASTSRRCASRPARPGVVAARRT